MQPNDADYTFPCCHFSHLIRATTFLRRARCRASRLAGCPVRVCRCRARAHPRARGRRGGGHCEHRAGHPQAVPATPGGAPHAQRDARAPPGHLRRGLALMLLSSGAELEPGALDGRARRGASSGYSPQLTFACSLCRPGDAGGEDLRQDRGSSPIIGAALIFQELYYCNQQAATCSSCTVIPLARLQAIHIPPHVPGPLPFALY